MSTLSSEKALQAEIPPTAHRPSPVVEVTLLLDPCMLAALESAARERGLTTAALVRRLVGGFLARRGSIPPLVG